MPEQIIGEIALSGSSKLIFSVSEWKGRSFASVRKFVATQRYEGPTNSGLVMNKQLLHELIVTIATLERSLPSNEEHEFKRIPKGDTEYLKIGTLPADDEGLPLVDVREFVDRLRYQGPTKRGFRFRWNLLAEVLACLREQAKIIGEYEKNEVTLFGPDTFEEPQKTVPNETCVKRENSIADLIGEEIKLFPNAFLGSTSGKGTPISLPDCPLRLEQDNTGNYYLRTDEEQFCVVRNPAEANFMIYAQMRGLSKVTVPEPMINVFKAVKAYENYARAVQTKLIAKVMKKVGQRSIAEYEARKKMDEAGLPWLHSE
jgi:hypothetical protein